MRAVYIQRLEKRTQSLGVKDFVYSLSLQMRHRWLWERSNQLDETIENILKPTEGAKRLFTRLIKRFKYIDHSGSQENLIAIARHIEEVWECNPDSTIIMPVCTKGNKHPDGSLKMIYDLRSALVNWKHSMIINYFDENDGHISSGCNVILCDDFIGSGSTIYKRIQKITNTLSPKAKLYVVSLAGMLEAREMIHSQHRVNFYSPVWLEKGIKDFWGTNIMLRMEGLLAPEYHKEKLKNCSLGYGKAGSLYFNEDYRIPNNVYPIFWWGKMADNRSFYSLFKRP